MAAPSFNNHEEAATHLAKTAMAAWDEAALVKQADVGQIMELLKKRPLLAGSLIGAGGGALYGAATSLGKEDEERNTLQSMLTGAMGGGLLGLGGGALYEYGRPLVNRYLRGLPPEGEGPDTDPEYTAEIEAEDLRKQMEAKKLRAAGKGPVGVDLEGGRLAEAIYKGRKDRKNLRADQITELNDWANGAKGEYFMDRWDAGESPELTSDSWWQNWLPRSWGGASDSARRLDLPSGSAAIQGRTHRFFQTADKNFSIQQQNQRGEAGPTAMGGAITGASVGGGMSLLGSRITPGDLQRGILADTNKSYEGLSRLTASDRAARDALTAAKKTRPGFFGGGRLDPSSWIRKGVGDVTVPGPIVKGVASAPIATGADDLLTAAKRGKGLRGGIGGIKVRSLLPFALGTAGGFLNSVRRNRLRSGN